MIDLYIKIPDYSWTVQMHCAVTCYHTDIIINELMDIRCPEYILNKAYKLISQCESNTGLTYSDPIRRISIVVIGITTDSSEFLSTLTHEVCHLVDDILGNSTDKEEYGYLTGNIHKIIYPYIHSLLCDKCRNC